MPKSRPRSNLPWLPLTQVQRRWIPMSTPNQSMLQHVANGASGREPQFSLALHNPDGREITFAEAVREALVEEMQRDPRVFIIGEDVAEAGTVWKVLKGMVEEFGPERIIDSPIS